MVHLAGAESFGATAYWGAYHSRCPFDQCQNRASRMIIGMGTPNNQSRIPRPIFPPMDGRKRALVIIVPRCAAAGLRVILYYVPDGISLEPPVASPSSRGSRHPESLHPSIK